MYGTVPNEMGNMKNLGDVDLSGCGLAGDIFGDIWHEQGKLRVMLMADNKFDGSVPSWTQQLQEFNYQNNDLGLDLHYCVGLKKNQSKVLSKMSCEPDPDGTFVIK